MFMYHLYQFSFHSKSQDYMTFASEVKPLIVKTQRNSIKLKGTLKQLVLELDKVAKCSTTPPPLPQTFQPLLDQLES